MYTILKKCDRRERQTAYYGKTSLSSGIFESLRPRTTFSFTVEVTDPILEENNRRFLLESDGTKIAVSTAAKENDTDRQISIAALTQILFGWVPYTEEKLPEVLQKDLNKIEPADGVFLNEIV